MPFTLRRTFVAAAAGLVGTAAAVGLVASPAAAANSGSVAFQLAQSKVLILQASNQGIGDCHPWTNGHVYDIANGSGAYLEMFNYGGCQAGNLVANVPGATASGPGQGGPGNIDPGSYEFVYETVV